MNPFLPVSIALLAAGVTFLAAGLALGLQTFMILGAVFMTVGTPMGIAVLTRKGAAGSR